MKIERRREREKNEGHSVRERTGRMKEYDKKVERKGRINENRNKRKKRE